MTAISPSFQRTLSSGVATLALCHKKQVSLQMKVIGALAVGFLHYQLEELLLNDHKNHSSSRLFSVCLNRGHKLSKLAFKVICPIGVLSLSYAAFNKDYKSRHNPLSSFAEHLLYCSYSHSLQVLYDEEDWPHFLFLSRGALSAFLSPKEKKVQAFVLSFFQGYAHTVFYQSFNDVFYVPSEGNYQEDFIVNPLYFDALYSVLFELSVQIAHYSI